jgi:hypothetical protein
MPDDTFQTCSARNLRPETSRLHGTVNQRQDLNAMAPRHLVNRPLAPPAPCLVRTPNYRPELPRQRLLQDEPSRLHRPPSRLATGQTSRLSPERLIMPASQTRAVPEAQGPPRFEQRVVTGSPRLTTRPTMVQTSVLIEQEGTWTCAMCQYTHSPRDVNTLDLRCEPLAQRECLWAEVG